MNERMSVLPRYESGDGDRLFALQNKERYFKKRNNVHCLHDHYFQQVSNQLQFQNL
jgi:hypothetical protein